MIFARQMSDEWVSALPSTQQYELLVSPLFELRKSPDRLNQTPSNNDLVMMIFDMSL